jgi:hypothetical protein
MAQGGGKDIDGLTQALSKIETLLEAQIKS